MKSNEKTVCFTGHRKVKDVETIKNKLISTVEKFINDGFSNFITGGARGFDTLAAQTVLLLKETYPHIKLKIALPFANPFEHEKDWSGEEIDAFFTCLKKSDKVVTLQEDYCTGCYYSRDRYLVENASVCIAYKKRSSGGTAYTVNYAYNKNIRVINLV